MNLPEDPDQYAKAWFFITLVGAILYFAASYFVTHVLGA